MARSGHKGHPVCDYTSKAACEKARRIAIGQCVAMLDEMRQCPHWGTDTVDGRGYCGQHINSVYHAAFLAHRVAETKAQLDAVVDRYLKQTGQTPHECGDHCEFSLIGGTP